MIEVRTQHQFDKAKTIERIVFERTRENLHLGSKSTEMEWRWESNGELIDMTQFWGDGFPRSYGDYLAFGNKFYNTNYSLKGFACVKSIYWI